MTRRRRRARRWRRILASLIAICGAACTSWNKVGPTPAGYLETHRPEKVRLTRLDSSRIDLRAPRLRGDSVLGIVGGGLAVTDTARQVAVPLHDVYFIEVRQFSPGKTMLLTLAVIASLCVIGCSNSSGPYLPVK